MLPKPPKITHVLSLPLGHHAALRERVTRFTDALVNATPPIPGIDRSIMVDPRRLSIPLVRMSLDDETLPKAKDALTALRPQVLDIIAALNTGSSNVRLRAPLTQIRVTRPYRNDIRHAHVMFAGASRSDPDWQALWTLAGKVRATFMRAGLAVGDEKKTRVPLRTTLINTIYRTPKSLDRIPFDYLGVLGSSAVTDISAGPTPEWLTRALARRDASSKGPGAVTGTDEAEPTSDASSGELIRKMENTTKRPQHQIPAWPVRVDLGTWDIDELQMCDVYSRGPEGEYVPVHSISLV